MNPIWKDRHGKRDWYVAGLSVMIVYLLVLPLMNANNLLVLVLLVVPLSLLVIILRMQFTRLYPEGVRIGNIKNGTYLAIRLDRAAFVSWANIKSLSIHKKRVEYPLYWKMEEFLLIITTAGQAYESFLVDSAGFRRTLVRLGKGKFLMNSS